MSSNYEWHKQQTGERIQARLREAEAHRQARQGRERHPVTGPLQMAIFAGLILALWFLAGCTPLTEPDLEGNVPAIGVGKPVVQSAATQPGMGWSMVERIAFQDRRDQQLFLDVAAVATSEQPVGWSMAERLHFQDRMYESGAYR